MTSCINCHSNETFIFYAGIVRNSSNLEDRVMKCNKCGLVFLPSSFKELDYQSSNYRESINEKNFTELDYHRSTLHDPGHISNIFRGMNINLNNLSILDFGCGPGNFLKSNKAPLKVGYDPDPEMQAFFQDDSEVIFFDDLKKLKLSYSDGFDIVISNYVIEHVDSVRGYLRSCYELCKDGGYLFISTPNLNDVLNIYAPKSFNKHFFREHHKWYFDIDSLSTSVEHTGFKLIKSGGVHRYDFSNFVNWISGNEIPGFSCNTLDSPELSLEWKKLLLSKNMTETIYLIGQK